MKGLVLLLVFLWAELGFGAPPELAGRKTLFVSRPQYKPDHHNTATMFQTGEINTASFEGGGALKVVEADSGAVTTLLDVPEGIVRDPEVSFEGDKVLFSMRRDRDDDYHIYEIDADGTGLRQLTFAAGVSDIDPVYLPEGDIVFSSTREPKYCMCNRHIMANLYRMEADGANIHQIGKNPLFEGHASLMPDGRLLYDRWEYVDRNFGSAQGLWTANPDGTGHLVYWGNNTHSPGAVLDARVVPGTQRAVCTFSSCHDRPWGAIALIDRRLGLDGRAGVVRAWPASAIELVDKGDFDQFIRVEPKYEDPYPLDAEYFLCSRKTGRGEQMGIYLLDMAGNETLVYAEEDEKRGCFDPMPLAGRERPAAIPARRGFEQGTGEFFVADVYRGTHMAGVARGMVKWLRVVETPEKRTWTHTSWNGQGQEAPAMNWHDFNNKRILGMAPVEADGSAYFTVPSGAFVYFQLLDENGMMVQSMRSGTMIQPGERQGCVGCHEGRLESAPLAGEMPLALRRGPSALADWYGPARTFSYAAEVQPVFDRNCVSCHDFGDKAGEQLLLCGDTTLTFNVSYEELWRKKYVNVVGGGPPEIVEALSWGSHASRLGQYALERYRAGKLDKEGLDRIVTWIDLNAPYYPEYGSAYPDNLAGRSPLTDAELKRLSELTRTPFAQQADHAKSPGPTVTFDRPDRSPCLKRLKKGSELYKEALAIIETGRQRLNTAPRGDTSDFALCNADCAREAKYAALRALEQRNREAISRGEKVYDAAVGPAE